LAALLLVGSRAVGAQGTVTVSGNPALLRINAAVAGSEPTVVTNAITTYTVIVTSGTRRITGRLLTAMPANTTLTVTLAAPPGATSLGPVALTLVEQDLVTGVPNLTNSTRGITYQLSAIVIAGVVANTNRNVRLRLR
jgi:hypothetical protein